MSSLHIFHGDNLEQSRQAMYQLLEKLATTTDSPAKPTYIPAKNLELPELEQALQSQSLFAEPNVVIIEELHSLQTSNRKKALLEYLQQQSEALPESTTIILWEKRLLTKTMLKKFPSAQDQAFNISKVLFKWLETLSPNQKTKTKQLKMLHQALEQEDTFLVFAMLIRQSRMLIQAKSGMQMKGAPFIIAKLKKQAQDFSLSQLISIHNQLAELDWKLKNSQLAGTLEQELDLLVLSM